MALKSVKSNDMTTAITLTDDIVLIVDGIQCVNGYGEWLGFNVVRKTSGTTLSAVVNPTAETHPTLLATRQAPTLQAIQ